MPAALSAPQHASLYLKDTNMKTLRNLFFSIALFSGAAQATTIAVTFNPADLIGTGQ